MTDRDRHRPGSPARSGVQNQTDDFAGFIAHSVNLAVKAIIAVAAMGQIAQAAGNRSDASYFDKKARHFISYWRRHAQDPAGQHLDLTYNGRGGGDGTWGPPTTPTRTGCWAPAWFPHPSGPSRPPGTSA
jgi:glutaminase A-like protein